MERMIDLTKFGASKAGVIQLTKYFSILFAKYNITINSISPGGIKNPKTQNSGFQKNIQN